MYLGISAFFPSSLYSQQLKIFKSRISYDKEKVGPMKHPREKKNRIYEIPARKILDPRITHQKKFPAYEIPKTARDPRNSAHLFSTLYIFQFYLYTAFSVSPSHIHFSESIFHLFFFVCYFQRYFQYDLTVYQFLHMFYTRHFVKCKVNMMNNTFFLGSY